MTHYLIRFDDICPTMDWSMWEDVESILLRHNVKPILAVVPDNQDKKLMVSSPVSDFWDRVRRWQSRGWTIALHGYQHVYENSHRGVIGVTPQSEFAGLPREIQKEKILKGLKIFESEDVTVDCWVAPSHSFDTTTVELLKENGIGVISDGLWKRPHRDNLEVVWLPQQMWDRIQPMTAGIWTVCYHHNDWKKKDLVNFGSDIAEFHNMITECRTAISAGRSHRLSLFERAYAFYILMVKFRIRPVVLRCLRFMKSR